jgi:hypothetical protein
VLLTGTPLNNNLRELFNLLNFLDEPNFSDLKDLEARFENLNENLVVQLHEMLKPYILRRVKADVLKLPPKVEIIVPISMTAPQRLLYKRILLKHREAINAILKQRKRKQPKAVEGPQSDPAPEGSGATSAVGVSEETVQMEGPESTSPIEVVEVADHSNVDVEMADESGKGAVSAPHKGTVSAEPAPVNGSANGGSANGGAVNGDSVNAKANGAPMGQESMNGRTDEDGVSGESTAPTPDDSRVLSPPMDLD